jgi:hypothetical protein
MATDTWQQASAAVAALLRRIRSPQQAGSVEREMESLRERVLTAREAGRTGTEQALAGIWQGRVQELLLGYPDLAADLRQILEETLAPMLADPECTRMSQVIMTGSSHGSSTFTQVAGNQAIIRS